MPNDTYTFMTKGADGKDVEVVVPLAAVHEAVKETHVAKDRIDTDLNRRVQAIIKNQNLRKPEELLEDEAFVASVLEKHGKQGGTEGDKEAQKQLTAAINKALADVDAKKIKPLEEQLKTLTAREQELLVRDLERQIIQAAAGAGVKKSLLKPQGKGKPAAIVAMLEDVFAYDSETGEFYVADGENFVLSTSSEKDSTYKTVGEFINEWAEGSDNVDFVDRTGQSGPGASGTKGGSGRSGDGKVILTREQASNPRDWDKALEQVGGDPSRIKVRSDANVL